MSMQNPKESMKEYAKSRIQAGNPITAKEFQNMFKEVFAEMMQPLFESELENQLGYSKYDWKNKETENSRNGYSKKKVKSDIAGEFEVKIPRDRESQYEPQLLKKYEKDISSIEDKILSMYSKGMSTDGINEHIHNIYGFSVSQEQVSRIVDKIMPVAKGWQDRPLKPIYPVIFLDGMVFDVKQDGSYKKKTAYCIIGINLDGYKELLGLWIGETESAKFWLSVLNDLKARGVQDVIISCIDGLNGFDTAIKSVFPECEIQRCIVHIIRNCTRYVNYKDRKAFCADMKPIYKATNEDTALQALTDFEDKWGKQYPYAVKVWYNNWDGIKTMFGYSPEIRHVIYTTNAIEGFNNGIKRITKTKSSFPSDDSLFKLLYLVSQDITKKWTMSIPNWSLIFGQFLIKYEDRILKFLNS
jgi:putative transposase